MGFKSKSIILILIFSLSLTLTVLAEEKSLDNLEVKLTSTINRDCGQLEERDEMVACYRPPNTIFLRNDLPKELLIRTFIHELGHFVIWEIIDADLEPLVNPITSYVGIDEFVADRFTLWYLGARVTSEQAAFFERLAVKWGGNLDDFRNQAQAQLTLLGKELNLDKSETKPVSLKEAGSKDINSSIEIGIIAILSLVILVLLFWKKKS